MAQPRLFEQPRRSLSEIERDLRKAEAEIRVKQNQLQICEQRVEHFGQRDLGYSMALKALADAELAHIVSLEKFSQLNLELRREYSKQIKEFGLDKLDQHCEAYQKHMAAKLASIERMPLSEQLLLSENMRKAFNTKMVNFRSKILRVKELRTELGVSSNSQVQPQKRFTLINAWLKKHAEFISTASLGDGRSVAGKILIQELENTVELHLRREGSPAQRRQAALAPRQRAEGEPEQQRAEGEPYNRRSQPR